MRADDILALGSIFAGAMAGVAVTLAVVLTLTFSSDGPAESPAIASPSPWAVVSDRPVVDFAIIREGPKLESVASRTTRPRR